MAAYLRVPAVRAGIDKVKQDLPSLEQWFLRCRLALLGTDWQKKLVTLIVGRYGEKAGPAAHGRQLPDGVLLMAKALISVISDREILDDLFDDDDLI